MSNRKKRQKSVKSQIGALVIILLVGFMGFSYREINVQAVDGEKDYPPIESPAEGQLGAKNEALENGGVILSRIVTAYNAVPEQTDDTPCITASGLDICKTKKKIAASNEFKFGTKLLIDDEIYEVQDRMNARYKYRIDLLMPTIQEARAWGRQVKSVILLAEK